MKELPILFSGPMVRAILEGRKTQTRRVVKPQAWSYANDLLGLPWIYAKSGPNDFGDPTPIRCPYGQPGDRLWVRETWQYADWTEDGEPWLRYRADGATLLPGWAPDDWLDRLESVWATLSDPENIRIDGKAADRKWRASILMPRWASRIELEVTGVRVERVQGISEADAQAEWVAAVQWDQEDHFDPVDRFAQVWDGSNAKRGHGWDVNPWVWVVEFRVGRVR